MQRKTTIIYFTSVTIALLIFATMIILKKGYYEIESRIEKIEKVESIGENYTSLGWLRIQGTNIDYQVVKENNGLLVYPVNKDKYVWLINENIKDKDFIIINGHNIFNLSSKPKIKDKDFTRLESLMAFVYYNFAKKNQYIQYTVDKRNYLYKIFSVAFINNDTMNSFISSNNSNYTKSAIKEQIDLYKEESLYNYDIKVDQNDKIITIATCTRFMQNKDMNFVVSGRLLRKDEKVNKTKITKNTKVYNTIEKIMKGDEK